MRSPMRQALLWFAAMAVGIILVRFGISAQQRDPEDWRNIAVAVSGLILTPIATVMGIWALLLAIGRMRLLAGHNVLGRWHLSSSAWQRFCALDQERTAATGFHNDYNTAKLSDDRGVDVIVGTKSALVGDSYHVLRRGGNPWLHGIAMVESSDPHCIEFAMTYFRKGTAGLRMALRLPFPPEASPDAARIYDHFAPLLGPRTSIALRHPGRTIGFSLAIAALAAGAAIWGFTGDKNDDLTLIAAVVGSVVAPSALVLALVTLLLSRRRAQG